MFAARHNAVNIRFHKIFRDLVIKSPQPLVRKIGRWGRVARRASGRHANRKTERFELFDQREAARRVRFQAYGVIIGLATAGKSRCARRRIRYEVARRVAFVKTHDRELFQNRPVPLRIREQGRLRERHTVPDHKNDVFRAVFCNRERLQAVFFFQIADFVLDTPADREA